MSDPVAGTNCSSAQARSNWGPHVAALYERIASTGPLRTGVLSYLAGVDRTSARLGVVTAKFKPALAGEVLHDLKRGANSMQTDTR